MARDHYSKCYCKRGVSHYTWWLGRLVVARAGLVILGIETALIEWGPGTWPDPGMPWIGAGVIGVGAIAMIVDTIWVGLYDRWLASHRDRCRPND